MPIFKSYTLWTPFERLSDPQIADLDAALSAKVIVDRSNIVTTCNGILCGMIYQQNFSPGLLNNISKVLLTLNLLIIACNRLQYEGNFDAELRTRVEQTGPLLPTVRYVVPEFLLIVLLVLEGFKAGGAAGATIVIVLFIGLFVLGWNFSSGYGMEKGPEIEVTRRREGNV
ncbi:hypothetical protein DL96DRAFT_1681868 [Flagelloscypha sp. PMI_526]|nr:hypothetical protein DL96DRAFT_1681868 [Flagelloscypha sp. PMI_526]